MEQRRDESGTRGRARPAGARGGAAEASRQGRGFGLTQRRSSPAEAGAARRRSVSGGDAAEAVGGGDAAARGRGEPGALFLYRAKRKVRQRSLSAGLGEG